MRWLRMAANVHVEYDCVNVMHICCFDCRPSKSLLQTCHSSAVKRVNYGWLTASRVTMATSLGVATAGSIQNTIIHITEFPAHRLICVFLNALSDPKPSNVYLIHHCHYKTNRFATAALLSFYTTKARHTASFEINSVFRIRF